MAVYNRIPGRRPKQVIYAGIWKNLDLVAEHSLPGNTSSVIRKLLEEGIKPNARASYDYEHIYHVHLYNLDTYTYCAVVESGYSKRLSFEMIEEMRNLRYPSSQDLEELTKKFNSNQSEDKISRINLQVSEVNDVVMTNIQRVLKNTTKMEVIAKKTEEMESKALMFKKAGNEFLSLARCQNIKWTIICGLSGLILIGALGCAFYFATG